MSAGWKLARLCAHFQIVGQITNRWNLDNQEDHHPIAVCQLTHPLGRVWSTHIAADHL